MLAHGKNRTIYAQIASNKQHRSCDVLCIAHISLVHVNLAPDECSYCSEHVLTTCSELLRFGGPTQLPLCSRVFIALVVFLYSPYLVCCLGIRSASKVRAVGSCVGMLCCVSRCCSHTKERPCTLTQMPNAPSAGTSVRLTTRYLRRNPSSVASSASECEVAQSICEQSQRHDPSPCLNRRLC